MRTALLLLVLSLAPIVSAAEGPGQQQATTTTFVEVLPADLSLSLSGRLSFPGGGYIDRSGTTTYGDIFNTGGGFSVEGDLLFHMDRRWRLGGYLSVGLDRFTGLSSIDDVGDTLKPDEMTIFTALIGGKSRFLFGPGFFWDGYVGLGVAHNSAVDATFIIGGTPLTGQELFSASSEFAFEAGARLGWGTPHFAALLGLGYRYMGGPGRGKDVTSEVSPDGMSSLTLDLGVQFTF